MKLYAAINTIADVHRTDTKERLKHLVRIELSRQEVLELYENNSPSTFFEEPELALRYLSYSSKYSTAKLTQTILKESSPQQSTDIQLISIYGDDVSMKKSIFSIVYQVEVSPSHLVKPLLSAVGESNFSMTDDMLHPDRHTMVNVPSYTYTNENKFHLSLEEAITSTHRYQLQEFAWEDFLQQEDLIQHSELTTISNSICTIS